MEDEESRQAVDRALEGYFRPPNEANLQSEKRWLVHKLTRARGGINVTKMADTRRRKESKLACAWWCSFSSHKGTCPLLGL